MTHVLVAVSLLLTNSPVSVAPVASAAGSETVVQSRDVFLPSTSARLDPTWTDSALLLTVEGEGGAHAGASVPAGVHDAAPSHPEPLSPIEQGMQRLAELGASPYELRVFGCLGWYESRNNPYAISPTGDYGWLQINRYYHAWRWAGRDIFNTVVNAEVAWDIYLGSGFRAWTTARFCV